MAKAYLKQSKNETIEVMGTQLVVQKLSFGETRSIVNECTFFDKKTKQNITDTTKIALLRVIRAIKSWDLTDENENVLPIEINTFDNLLDENYVAEVMQAVEAVGDNSVTDEEKKA